MIYISALRLPEYLREDYAVSLGPVTDNLEAIISSINTKGLICVGDIVSKACLKALSESKRVIAVYDGKTLRKQTPDLIELEERDYTRRRVVNPAGYLTIDSLKFFCEDLQELAVNQTVRVLVQVSGEEDLVALGSLSCGPEGWHVIYGLPNTGAVLVPLNRLNKNITQNRVIQLKPDITLYESLKA